MAISPAETETLFRRAWQAQTAGRIEAAVAVYQQILAGTGDASPQAWLGIGQCELERRQPQAALAAFRRASALLPDSGAIRHLVAMLEGGEAPARAPDDYVLWVFDGHAESFDSHLAALGYRGPQMIADLAAAAWRPEAAPTRAILDLGCGTGQNAPLFRPHALRLDGVDLAPRMLQQSARRGGYDHLYKAEAHAFLRQPPVRYDVILSTDVFIYIGRLDDIFMFSKQCLNPGGEILCTVELHDGAEPVQLMPTGRFRQSDAHVRAASAAAGFAVADSRDGTLRVEQGRAEPGRAYRLILAA